jgi:hypothetical protein
MTVVLRVALAIRPGHAHSPLTGVSTKCFQRCVSLLMSRKRRKAPPMRAFVTSAEWRSRKRGAGQLLAAKIYSIINLLKLTASNNVVRIQPERLDPVGGTYET